MDNFVHLIIGMLLMYLILQKPLQITIHHKNENVVKPVPENIIPKMSEVLKENDKQEDDAYEEMGSILGEVNKIFGGSDRE